MLKMEAYVIVLIWNRCPQPGYKVTELLIAAQIRVQTTAGVAEVCTLRNRAKSL